MPQVFNPKIRGLMQEFEKAVGEKAPNYQSDDTTVAAMKAFFANATFQALTTTEFAEFNRALQAYIFSSLGPEASQNMMLRPDHKSVIYKDGDQTLLSINCQQFSCADKVDAFHGQADVVIAPTRCNNSQMANDSLTTFATRSFMLALTVAAAQALGITVALQEVSNFMLTILKRLGCEHLVLGSDRGIDHYNEKLIRQNWQDLNDAALDEEAVPAYFTSQSVIVIPSTMKAPTVLDPACFDWALKKAVYDDLQLPDVDKFLKQLATLAYLPASESLMISVHIPYLVDKFGLESTIIAEKMTVWLEQVATQIVEQSGFKINHVFVVGDFNTYLDGADKEPTTIDFYGEKQSVDHAIHFDFSGEPAVVTMMPREVFNEQAYPLMPKQTRLPVKGILPSIAGGSYQDDTAATMFMSWYRKEPSAELLLKEVKDILKQTGRALKTKMGPYEVTAQVREKEKSMVLSVPLKEQRLQSSMTVYMPLSLYLSAQAAFASAETVLGEVLLKYVMMMARGRVNPSTVVATCNALTIDGKQLKAQACMQNNLQWCQKVLESYIQQTRQAFKTLEQRLWVSRVREEMAAGGVSLSAVRSPAVEAEPRMATLSVLTQMPRGKQKGDAIEIVVSRRVTMAKITLADEKRPTIINPQKHAAKWQRLLKLLGVTAIADFKQGESEEIDIADLIGPDPIADKDLQHYAAMQEILALMAAVLANTMQAAWPQVKTNIEAYQNAEKALVALQMFRLKAAFPEKPFADYFTSDCNALLADFDKLLIPLFEMIMHKQTCEYVFEQVQDFYTWLKTRIQDPKFVAATLQEACSKICDNGQHFSDALMQSRLQHIAEVHKAAAFKVQAAYRRYAARRNKVAESEIFQLATELSDAAASFKLNTDAVKLAEAKDAVREEYATNAAAYMLSEYILPVCKNMPKDTTITVHCSPFGQDIDYKVVNPSIVDFNAIKETLGTLGVQILKETYSHTFSTFELCDPKKNLRFDIVFVHQPEAQDAPIYNVGSMVELFVSKEEGCWCVDQIHEYGYQYQYNHDYEGSVGVSNIRHLLKALLSNVINTYLINSETTDVALSLDLDTFIADLLTQAKKLYQHIVITADSEELLCRKIEDELARLCLMRSQHPIELLATVYQGLCRELTWSSVEQRERLIKGIVQEMGPTKPAVAMVSSSVARLRPAEQRASTSSLEGGAPKADTSAAGPDLQTLPPQPAHCP